MSTTESTVNDDQAFEEIRQILQVTDGAETINILATFLKAAIDGISPTEARIEVLNDVILFLKEPEHATQ
jgi:hypothetical protein